MMAVFSVNPLSITNQTTENPYITLLLFLVVVSTSVLVVFVAFLLIQNHTKIVSWVKEAREGKYEEEFAVEGDPILKNADKKKLPVLRKRRNKIYHQQETEVQFIDEIGEIPVDPVDGKSKGEMVNRAEIEKMHRKTMVEIDSRIAEEMYDEAIHMALNLAIKITKRYMDHSESQENLT